VQSVVSKHILKQGSIKHAASQGCLCGPCSSKKLKVVRIFIEMLEFLCCFGKNVVNKAIKMKKYSHILQHIWPLRAIF
jgi:hypothetical protein